MDTVDDDSGILELGCDGTFDISSAPDPAPASLDDITVETPVEKPSWALAKDSGNALFSKGNFGEAMKEYTKALDLGKAVAGDVEMGKVYSNRAISSLKEAMPDGKSLPATFSIRTMDPSTQMHNAETRSLLAQSLDDCDKSLSHFSVVPIGAGDGKNKSNVVKALHRKTLAYGLLGKKDAALSASVKCIKILTSSSSVPLSLKTSVEDLHHSLLQLDKDVEAIRTSLEGVSAMVMKEKDINPTKAALSCSINCVQSGGSVAAALHVSSVTAYNLITTKTTVDSSETLHAVIMELTECIAKVCHYHKLNVQGSAEVMYDVCLRRCFTSDVKYVGGDDSDSNDSENNEVNVWKMIGNEKFRCCGICCAMLASLRSENMEKVVTSAEEGVKAVGGSLAVAKEVGKMFGGAEEESAKVEEGELVEECEEFKGEKEGEVFKLGPKGLGYYKDNGPMWVGGGKVHGKKKEKEEKMLLDPDHPAFKDMTKEQVKAMEQVLKMSDEEVAALPGEQNSMIMEFRKMYKENPSVFQKRPNQPKPDEAKKKKEKKETDPLQSFKESQATRDWFKSKHGNFDKEKFEEEEKQRLEKIEQEKKLVQAERMERVAKEMEEMGVVKEEKKVDVNKEKKKKKKTKKKSSDKKKELDELMGWAKGN